MKSEEEEEEEEEDDLSSFFFFFFRLERRKDVSNDDVERGEKKYSILRRLSLLCVYYKGVL